MSSEKPFFNHPVLYFPGFTNMWVNEFIFIILREILVALNFSSSCIFTFSAFAQNCSVPTNHHILHNVAHRWWMGNWAVFHLQPAACLHLRPIKNHTADSLFVYKHINTKKYCLKIDRQNLNQRQIQTTIWWWGQPAWIYGPLRTTLLTLYLLINILIWRNTVSKVDRI